MYLESKVLKVLQILKYCFQFYVVSCHFVLIIRISLVIIIVQFEGVVGNINSTVCRYALEYCGMGATHITNFVSILLNICLT